jgi:hypothetical protein
MRRQSGQNGNRGVAAAPRPRANCSPPRPDSGSIEGVASWRWVRFSRSGTFDAVVGTVFVEVIDLRPAAVPDLGEVIRQLDFLGILRRVDALSHSRRADRRAPMRRVRNSRLGPPNTA